MTLAAKPNTPSLSTLKSEAMWREAMNYEPMGAQGEGKFYAPFPVFIQRARGSRLWDVDGNEYIDYWNGAGPCVLGHAEPTVNNAAKSVLDDYGVVYCAPHEWELNLAKKIAEVVPSGEMSAFGCGGSDALCYAVRAARAHTGRTKILKFEGSYHGWYDGLLFGIVPDIEDSGPDEAPLSRPESKGLPPEASQHITVLPYNDPAAVERVFKAEGDKYACLIVEPVMHGSGVGVIEPKAGYLKFLRDICTRYGIVLVFDEILTGFRHHVGGVQKLMGVTPDLTALGKALSNGFPICSLSGKREFVSELTPGRAYFSGTFNGNIMCVAAALKTIEMLSDGTAHKKLWALGERLGKGVNDAAARLGIKVRARYYGSMVAVHFSDRDLWNYRDVLRNHDKTLNTALIAWVNDHGIYTKPRRCNRFAISTAHTEADIDRTVEVIESFMARHRGALQ
jgi:glutamate-1-semialdehyde 2,1-aminomutase